MDICNTVFALFEEFHIITKKTAERRLFHNWHMYDKKDHAKRAAITSENSKWIWRHQLNQLVDARLQSLEYHGKSAGLSVFYQVIFKMEHDSNTHVTFHILQNPHKNDTFPDPSMVKTEVNEDNDITVAENNPYLKIKREINSTEDDPNVCEAVSGVLNTGTHHESTTLPCQSLQMCHNDVYFSVISNEKQMFPLQDVAHITRNIFPVSTGSGEICIKSVLKTNMKESSTEPIIKPFLVSNSVNLQYGGSDVSGNTNNYNNSEFTANVTDIPNKIMLGSKIIPHKAPEVRVSKEYLPTVVVLEDWGTILKASSRFCGSCKILFPTVKGFDTHKISHHSILYNSEIIHSSGTRDIVKNHQDLRKYIINNPIPTTRRVKKRKQSNCDEESVHSAKSFRNSAKSIQNTTKRISYFDETISLAQCYHCDKVFLDNAALIKHLYTILPDNESRDDVTIVKDNSASNCVFTCQICMESFSNETIAKFHKRFMHPNQSGNITKSCVLDRDERDLNNSKAEVTEVIVRKRKLIKVGNNKSNIDNTNKIDVKNDLVTKDLLIKKHNLEYKYMRGVIIRNPPIPIGVLFKCHKCDLHLINAQNAYDHSRVCKDYKSKYQCKKCKRKFRVGDVEMHELQHLVTKSFKAYKIQQNLPKRLLCRCPKCNICFTEHLFWKHLRSPCDKKCIYCKKCKLNIDRETYMKTAHMYCGENVLIDYFDSIEESKVKRKHTKVSVGEKDKKTYKLWYCEICKRCGKIDKGSHNCNLKNRSMCKHCGLYFNVKLTNAHSILHSKLPLNLHNFLLFSIQKRKFVKPTMLRYKFCPKCKMHYLRWHMTCSETYRICDICSKKFEKDHYTLHKQFHTYDLDNLIRETLDSGGYVGYKTPMCIYHCIQCKCFVISYDNAVRHAHSHITRKSLENIHCTKCDRIYESTSSKEHKHSLAKFKILKFDYRNLVSDAWFDVFDGLDQVEIGDILKDSVFKDTRSLDLTLVQKGDPDMTLYICSSCNVLVEKTALEKHVTNKLYCCVNRKYKCGVCDLYFCSPDSMEVHKKLHSTGARKEDFHIISFNNIGKMFVDAEEALEKFSDKPVKSCTKLVLLKKTHDKENLRMQNEIVGDHDDNDKSESEASSNVPEECCDDVNKEVKLYKCVNCKVCIFSIKGLKNHYCRPTLSQFCEICQQLFYNTNWKKHCFLIHNKDKNINFKLKYFKIKINLKGRRQVNFVKVVNAFYDKSKMKNKTFKTKFINVKETVMNSGNDEGPLDDVKSKTNNEKSDDNNDCFQNKGRTAIPNNVIKDVKLFKCITCKTCIIKSKNILRHTCTTEFYRRFCNVCQQWFSFASWKRHRALHKGVAKINISIKYFKPKRKAYAKRTFRKQLKSKWGNGGNEEGKRENRLEKSVCGTTNNVVNENVPEADNDVNDKVLNTKDTDIQPDERLKHNTPGYNEKREVKVFKCTECKLCLLVFRNKNNHNCVSVSKQWFCRICKQSYNGQTFNQHCKLFCNDNNSNIKIINFTPGKSKHSNTYLPRTTRSRSIKVATDTGETSKGNDSINVNVENNLRADKDEKNMPKEKDIVVNIKDVEIYKCVHCQTCVIRRRILDHHCLIEGYKRFCDICNQFFSSHAFARHIEWHQDNIHNKINLIVKHFTPKQVVYAPIPVKKQKTKVVKGKKSKASDTGLKEKKQPPCHSNSKKTLATNNKNTRNEKLPTLDDSESVNPTNDDNLKDSNTTVTKDVKVYKCVHCDICCFTTGNLYRHVCIFTDAYKKFCDICQQWFVNSNFKRHNILHKEYKKINLIIKYHEPKKISYGKRNKNIKAIVAIDKNKGNSPGATICEAFDGDDIYYKNVSYEVFVCNQCNVYYLTTGGRKHHKNRKKHEISEALEYCRYCKLRFTKRSIQKHLTECPWKGKRGYIRIVGFQNKTEKIHKWTDADPFSEDESEASDDEEDYKPSRKSRRNDKSAETTAEISSNLNENETYKLYVCSQCDVYYLTNSSRIAHMTTFKHLIIEKPKHCKYCNLRFNKMSLKRHQLKCPWKDKRGYITIVDFTNNKDIIHKWPDAELNSIYDNVVNNENVDNPKVTDATEQNNIINSISMNTEDVASESRNIEDNVDKNSTRNVSAKAPIDDIAAEDVVELSNSEQIENIKATVEKKSMIPGQSKLFSCKECDVYFLKAECFQTHVVNHVKLSAREYIKCKVCLLQFLIVDLHMHMVTHHNEEFKFENVTVEEFVPNDASKPRIYNLKIKLQSLITSTTCMKT